MKDLFCLLYYQLKSNLIFYSASKKKSLRADLASEEVRNTGTSYEKKCSKQSTGKTQGILEKFLCTKRGVKSHACEPLRMLN